MPDPLGLLQLCFRFGEITLGSYKRRFPNTTHTTFLYLLFLIKSLSQLSIGFLFLASLSMTPPSQSLPSTSTLSTIVTGPGWDGQGRQSWEQKPPAATPCPRLLTVVGMALQPLSPFLNMTELCIETVQLKQGLGPLRAVKPTAEKPVL